MGNRSRLPSGVSTDGPDDLLSDLTARVVNMSGGGDYDYEERAPKIKRSSSGTNLISRRDSFRKNRYSFGDEVPSSGVGGYYVLPGPATNTAISAGSSAGSSSINDRDYQGGKSGGEGSRTNTTSGSTSSTSTSRTTNSSSSGGSISRSNSTSTRSAIDDSQLQSIIAARRPNIKKNPGKSIESIKANPTNALDGHVRKYMTIVSNFLVIGGREDAGNRADLIKLGVTHILNCALQVPNYFSEDFIYEHIPILDDEKTDIKEMIAPVLRFLGDVEDNQGRCLVHCVSGVSRSVTAVIIYLMHRHKMCLRHSFDYLKSCRPFICPNEGFKVQLARMEVDLFGYTTVSKKAGKPWEFYAWNEIKNTYKYQDPSSLLEKSSSVCTLS